MFSDASAGERMVAEQLIPRGIKDLKVLMAMRRVPRDRFVEGEMTREAYADRPLPIGEGQTISQPYIVALMTEALELEGTEKTLEIGTGSGYQTAILAELSAQVYTVERISELQIRSRHILESLGYTNISFKTFDGTLGWEEKKPFNAIIVTAGAPRIPTPLLNQLAERGRMIIPIGDRFSQELIKLKKQNSQITSESLGGCRFVALLGEYGW